MGSLNVTHIKCNFACKVDLCIHKTIKISPSDKKLLVFRAVEKFENPGLRALFGGHNLPPVVEIGLTDLPKSGSAMAQHSRGRQAWFYQQ